MAGAAGPPDRAALSRSVEPIRLYPLVHNVDPTEYHKAADVKLG